MPNEVNLAYSIPKNVNQGLKTWAFSVPKNPEFEHVIPKAFADLFENWRCRHQKDSGNLDCLHRGELRSWRTLFALCGMTCQGIFRDTNSRRLQLLIRAQVGKHFHPHAGNRVMLLAESFLATHSRISKAQPLIRIKRDFSCFQRANIRVERRFLLSLDSESALRLSGVDVWGFFDRLLNALTDVWQDLARLL